MCRQWGYGDGIYRSGDGGRTWARKGLERSEHISKILIHPEDSDTLWVAAQGPLWSQGGERGVFPLGWCLAPPKSSDSWAAISGDLTRDQERLTLPIMGQTRDISAMSAAVPSKEIDLAIRRKQRFEAAPERHTHTETI